MIRHWPHIMVDLETTGSVPGSGILSIGAVGFDTMLPVDRWEPFQVPVISRESCLKAGLTEDEETLKWWSTQDDAAQIVLRKATENVESYDIQTALYSFQQWFTPSACIWGNGADFDNAMLACAYKKCRMMPPWRYTNNRCYRTMKRMFSQIEEPVFEGVRHNALADAIHQAKHLCQIFAFLRRKGA